jgi:hypothetical protein
VRTPRERPWPLFEVLKLFAKKVVKVILFSFAPCFKRFDSLSGKINHQNPFVAQLTPPLHLEFLTRCPRCVSALAIEKFLAQSGRDQSCTTFVLADSDGITSECLAQSQKTAKIAFHTQLRPTPKNRPKSPLS